MTATGADGARVTYALPENHGGEGAPAVLLARLSWAAFEGPILRLKEKFPYEPSQQPAVTATPTLSKS